MANLNSTAIAVVVVDISVVSIIDVAFFLVKTVIELIIIAA